MKKAEITKEQIEIWKKQYGSVFRLTADDGKTAIIRDPMSDMPTMKKAFIAWEKSPVDYCRSIIADCFLAGDEEIRDQEGYAEGLEGQIFDIVEMPEAELKRISATKYLITCEGYKVEVRPAQRADVQKAERKNSRKQPYETNIQLLKIIGLSGVEEVMKNTRALVGVLSQLDEVRNKVSVAVEKL